MTDHDNACAKAFNEGADARIAGLPQQANPYKLSTAFSKDNPERHYHAKWLEGWLHVHHYWRKDAVRKGSVIKQRLGKGLKMKRDLNGRINHEPKETAMMYAWPKDETEKTDPLKRISAPEHMNETAICPLCGDLVESRLINNIWQWVHINNIWQWVHIKPCKLRKKRNGKEGLDQSTEEVT